VQLGEGGPAHVEQLEQRGGLDAHARLGLRVRREAAWIGPAGPGAAVVELLPLLQAERGAAAHVARERVLEPVAPREADQRGRRQRDPRAALRRRHLESRGQVQRARRARSEQEPDGA